ncbi:MAG: patatin-like phospholipase family protein [Burkholderiaceae bacterium]
MERKPPIYLALSGGGTRAMAFHIGLLTLLAEHDALERVEEISTVSGGTLLIGLLLRTNDYQWPSSSRFLDHVYPALFETLRDRTLQLKLFPRRFFDISSMWEQRSSHWLAKGITAVWDIDVAWGDLPKTPKWTVNTTSAETGKRFYFSGKWLNCYEIGKTNADEYRLADIMAASAAVPGFIGPWVIPVVREEWKRSGRKQLEGEHLIEQYSKLHLYDGGLYDNLGLEQFKGVGNGFKKDYRDGVVVVSDAGKPLDNVFDRSRFNPFRWQNLMNIPLDQTRALRVRDFQSYLREYPGSGAHIRIGVTKKDLRTRADAGVKKWLDSIDILRDEEVGEVAKMKTRLHGFQRSVLELIIRNGRETAEASFRLAGVKGFDF